MKGEKGVNLQAPSVLSISLWVYVWNLTQISLWRSGLICLCNLLQTSLHKYREKSWIMTTREGKQASAGGLIVNVNEYPYCLYISLCWRYAGSVYAHSDVFMAVSFLECLTETLNCFFYLFLYCLLVYFRGVKCPHGGIFKGVLLLFNPRFVCMWSINIECSAEKQNHSSNGIKMLHTRR